MFFSTVFQSYQDVVIILLPQPPFVRVGRRETVIAVLLLIKTMGR